MTSKEYNSLPVFITEKADDIQNSLNKKNKDVYTFDIATLILIVEIIIKIVGWFSEWKNAKESKLTLLQRGQLWFIIKFSPLKGASYTDVVDTIFHKLDEDTFNAVKKGRFI